MDIRRLADLEEEIGRIPLEGKAGSFIRNEYMEYDFSIPVDFKSILVISFPQPHAYVELETEKGVLKGMIPSGYYNGDQAVGIRDAVIETFERNGEKAKRMHLPMKLLGARSGLTKYGKNNISYVEKFGSQHRLNAFYTTLEPSEDVWELEEDLEICQSCQACAEACPYGAIPKSEFLLDTNRCLSFYLDFEDPLPEWTNYSKINTLVGCDHCQDCCPLNASAEMVQWGRIPCGQLQEILGSDNYDDLSEETRTNLKMLGFDDWYGLFRRNLKLVCHR